MRHTAREPADRLHFLRLQQLRLEGLALGDVAGDRQRGGASGKRQRVPGDVYVDNRAILLAVSPLAGLDKPLLQPAPMGARPFNVLRRPNRLERHPEEFRP